MLPSTERFHSRIAATNKAAIVIVRPRDRLAYNSSSDWPDQNSCSKRSLSMRARRNAKSFSKMIAHDQIEARPSPVITILTTMLACRNSSTKENPAALTGATTP